MQNPRFQARALSLCTGSVTPGTVRPMPCGLKRKFQYCDRQVSRLIDQTHLPAFPVSQWHRGMCSRITVTRSCKNHTCFPFHQMQRIRHLSLFDCSAIIQQEMQNPSNGRKAFAYVSKLATNVATISTIACRGSRKAWHALRPRCCRSADRSRSRYSPTSAPRRRWREASRRSRPRGR